LTKAFDAMATLPKASVYPVCFSHDCNVAFFIDGEMFADRKRLLLESVTFKVAFLAPVANQGPSTIPTADLVN
jgi:hypothetical protein